MLTIEKFVEEITDYSSDCDYEDLHYYVERFPNLFHQQYPIYEKMVKRGASSDQAIKNILNDELGWIWQ